MARFAVPGNKGTATVRTIVAARAAAASTIYRGRVYDYTVGMVTAPNATDFQLIHQLFRTSSAGTGASVTPVPLDPAEAAAVATGLDTVTADPSIGTILFNGGLNQRASWRWVAPPGGELVWPATASNGIAGGLSATSAVDFSGTIYVDTQ